MNKKDEQAKLISDKMISSLLNCGLGLGLVMINKPSLELPYLFLGVPFIIWGMVTIIGWNIYFDHRISILKWQTIISVSDFLISTILFFKTPMNIHVPERVIYYLLNTVVVVILIILCLNKRNKLICMKEAKGGVIR